VDRATRKELKTDHFAEKVGIAVEEVTAHKKEVTRYGIIGLIVVVLIVAGVTWYRSQAATRRAAFDALLRTMEAPIAPPGQSAGTSYATQEEKDKAVAAALEEFTKKYAGTNEEALARYFIASNAIEDGQIDKALTEVEVAIRNGNSDTADIARFMKGNILASQGKNDEAEKIYRELLGSSSGFLSKDEVTVALAKVLAKKNPDEAVKLLEPLRLSEGPTQRIASQTIDQIRSAKN
jgi:predicted negative regulator of RcsB-dependent stress response